MKRIAELRKKNGLQQKELAEKLHISAAALSTYETGTRAAPYETLCDIANLFDVSTDYLLERSDNPARFDWPGVDGEILIEVLDLTPQEKERVLAFISGLKANRR